MTSMYPRKKSKYPEHPVKIRTLIDNQERETTLQRIASRQSWNGKPARSDGSPGFERYWVALFAKNPQDEKQAREWSDAHCLWFVLEKNNFMTPCVLVEPSCVTPKQKPAPGLPESAVLEHFIDKEVPQPGVRLKSDESASVEFLKKDPDDLWDFYD